MNEVLAYRLYRDAGALAPRTTYAQVYLTVDGQPEKRYLGLYSVSENVDENFAEDRFGTKKGAIFKPSTQELFTDWGPDWADLQPVVRSQDRSDRRRRSSGSSRSAGSCRAHPTKSSRRRSATTWTSTTSPGTSPSSSGSPTTTACCRTARTSTPTCIRTRTGCTSSPGTRTSRSGTRATNGSTWSIYAAWASGNRFLSRLYNVDAFRSKYLARMAEFSERLFVADRFAQQVSEIGAGHPPVSRARRQGVAGELRSGRRRPFRHRAVRREPGGIRKGGTREEVATERLRCLLGVQDGCCSGCEKGMR